MEPQCQSGAEGEEAVETSRASYLHAGDLLVVEELVGPLAQVEVPVVVLGLVQVPGVVAGLEEPGSRPGELVPVVGALVVLGRAPDRLVVEAPVHLAEVVELPGVPEELVRVGGVDLPEEEARRGQSRGSFAGQVRAYGRQYFPDSFAMRL
jgi:hypothetical protein